MSDLLNELNDIDKKRQKVVDEIAAELLNEVTKKTPVKSGNLKNSWELIEDGDGWIVFNSAIYASFALAPRISEQGISQGSDQFPAGVQPTIDKYDRELQRRLNAI